MFALIAKELRQISRDRILLANAISVDIVDIPVAVIDYDLSPLSRDIITALDNTQELKVVAFPADLDQARHLIDSGQVMAVGVIPRGFMAGLASNHPPQMQVFLDGVSSLIAARALGAMQGAIQSLVEEAVVVASHPRQGGIAVYVDALFNGALDFRPESITSQMSLIIFEITMLVAVMGIVREREFGTIEMLSITPLGRLEVIAGKAITPLLIGLIDLFAVTQIIFDVPFRGSFLTLLGLTILYLSCEIGYALMISTVTRTQQQAVTTVFVWVMVAMTLSGYLVPISNLPKVMEIVSWAVPLRHYLVIVRGIMLKGAGVMDMLPNVVALVATSLAVLFLSTRTLTRAIE